MSTLVSLLYIVCAVAAVPVFSPSPSIFMRVPLKVTNDTVGQGVEDWLTEEDAGYPLSLRAADGT